MQKEDTIMNVFEKKNAEGMYVQLSDGRQMLWEDLVEDYERLLKEKTSPKEEVPKLEVGKWFLIDRDVIDKNREKINRVCGERRDRGGRLYRERFEESNKIADAEPERYPRQSWHYVFEKIWECKNEQEMRIMCKRIGDRPCDEVDCDLELQMRICNGETAYDLFEKADKLPCVRVIQLRNGGTGYFGGGADYNYSFPPARLIKDYFIPHHEEYYHTPYVFRRKLSRH